MSAILKSAILDSAILNKKNFTHSLSLNFMMAAILNTAILDSAILHKTLTQTNSFSLNLMISAILYSAILDSAILNKKKTSLIHSDSNLWWQPSWILPSWIQLFCTKKLHSYILTQLDDGSHLEMCHLGFSHFAQNSDSNSFILTQL